MLFPHNSLTEDAYAEVASTLFDTLAASPETATLLEIAATALDAQVDGAWMDAADDRQVAALRNIEGEAFFAAILATVRGAFYYNPKVWAHLDYPGSSKEHGGYKHRGFDDISWLPEVE